MNNTKILIAGIAGGVTFFLLGWLFYGILLMDVMMQCAGTVTGVHKHEMEFGLLFIAQLAWGFLFAIILGRWSHGTSIIQGMERGAVIGLLTGLFNDLTMYSTTNITTLKGALIDVVTMAIIGVIGGGIVAFILNTGKKQENTH